MHSNTNNYHYYYHIKKNFATTLFLSDSLPSFLTSTDERCNKVQQTTLVGLLSPTPERDIILLPYIFFQSIWHYPLAVSQLDPSHSVFSTSATAADGQHLPDQDCSCRLSLKCHKSTNNRFFRSDKTSCATAAVSREAQTMLIDSVVSKVNWFALISNGNGKTKITVPNIDIELWYSTLPKE